MNADSIQRQDAKAQRSLTAKNANHAKGLQARPMIAQGKASLRATPWVNREKQCKP